MAQLCSGLVQTCMVAIARKPSPQSVISDVPARCHSPPSQLMTFVFNCFFVISTHLLEEFALIGIAAIIWQGSSSDIY